MRRAESAALAHCYQILETSGDYDLCCRLYPHVVADLAAHLALQRRLAATAAPPPALQTRDQMPDGARATPRTRSLR